MKIVVTGGAGFIGSHLCERLVKDNNIVISIDNYSTGSKDNHVEGVEYIEADTNDINNLRLASVDLVYHLGEYSRVEQSFDDLETVWKSNKNGTFSVLEFCRKQSCKLVYAGSSTKFGDGGAGRNQSPYGWTKATNTELVLNYQEWFSLPVAVAYFYNAYGPREIKHDRYATLVAIFAEKMKRGEQLTVVLPGSQQRTFTHVFDIVDGLVMVGENGIGDNFGIGCDTTYSIDEVADLFGGMKKYLPERKGNRLTAEVRTDKTTALGWKSKHTLRDYIENLKLDGWK